MPIMMPIVMAALCSCNRGESTFRCLIVRGMTAAAAAGVVVITAVVGVAVAGMVCSAALFLCWF